LERWRYGGYDYGVDPLTECNRRVLAFDVDLLERDSLTVSSEPSDNKGCRDAMVVLDLRCLTAFMGAFWDV
jgi:hypothetical protein